MKTTRTAAYFLVMVISFVLGRYVLPSRDMNGAGIKHHVFDTIPGNLLLHRPECRLIDKSKASEIALDWVRGKNLEMREPGLYKNPEILGYSIEQRSGAWIVIIAGVKNTNYRITVDHMSGSITSVEPVGKPLAREEVEQLANEAAINFIKKVTWDKKYNLKGLDDPRITIEYMGPDYVYDMTVFRYKFKYPELKIDTHFSVGVTTHKIARVTPPIGF